MSSDPNPSSPDPRSSAEATQEAATAADVQPESSPPEHAKPAEAGAVSAGDEPIAATSDGESPGKRIQVGSRRPESGVTVTSSQPQVPGTDKPVAPAPTPPRRERKRDEKKKGEKSKPLADERPPVTVTPPTRRTPLPPDLERELEAVMADASVDELISGEAVVAESKAQLEVETRLRATIVKIHGDNIFFSLSGRHEGVASLRSFRDPPNVGDSLEVVITGFQQDDGLYDVNVPGASVEVQDWSDLIEGAIVEAKITGTNTGGLECTVGSIRGFIPASQVEIFHVDNLADYADEKLLCVVTEANERRRNLVLSHRALVERERAEQKEKLLAELEVGDIREGVVTNIRDFGAFVDIGGVDGLVHISQLSWDRIQHPSEVLQEGQKVRVKVEKVDQQTGKIGLSYRDLLEDPWSDVDQNFPAGTMVKGVVSRIANFGAFVKLAPGVEGLVHISELAHHRVVQVGSVVQEGQEVEVKVLSVDPNSQRISLSLKAAHPIGTEGTAADDDETDEPPRELTVPRRNEPLKGGTDRPSGGETFGLKW